MSVVPEAVRKEWKPAVFAAEVQADPARTYSDFVRRLNGMQGKLVAQGDWAHGGPVPVAVQCGVRPDDVFLGGGMVAQRGAFGVGWPFLASFSGVPDFPSQMGCFVIKWWVAGVFQLAVIDITASGGVDIPCADRVEVWVFQLIAEPNPGTLVNASIAFNAASGRRGRLSAFWRGAPEADPFSPFTIGLIVPPFAKRRVLSLTADASGIVTLPGFDRYVEPDTGSGVIRNPGLVQDAATFSLFEPASGFKSDGEPPFPVNVVGIVDPLVTVAAYSWAWEIAP